MKKESNFPIMNDISFIKTILMLLVVLYHSSVFWTGTWFSDIAVSQDSTFLNFFSKRLNSFHIHTFTLVSGYIFNFLYGKGKYRKFRKFFVKKIKRLIVPYWFITMVWLIPISVVLFSMDFRKVFYNFILCITPDQLWFLWMLFNVFVMSWFLGSHIKKNNYAIFICFLSYCLSFIGGKLIPNIFCIWSALRFLTFFLIGMKLEEKLDKKLKQIPVFFYIIVHSILFIIVTILSCKTGLIYTLLYLGFTYIMNIAGSLMAFYVLRDISAKFDWQNSKLFNILSNKTMIIYLFHQQIIYFTIILLNGKIPPLLNMLVNFITAMFISYIISVLLLKNKTTRMLVGEK